jgi:hypothetical protein
MKNDIKSKNFIVIRKYKPSEDDFFDDNPSTMNDNNNIIHNNFNEIYDNDNCDNYGNCSNSSSNSNSNSNNNFDNNISKKYDQEYNENQNNINNNLLNISEIDISSLVVNFELNYNIFDPYQTYSDYTDNAYIDNAYIEEEENNNINDDITFNFFG